MTVTNGTVSNFVAVDGDTYTLRRHGHAPTGPSRSPCRPPGAADLRPTPTLVSNTLSWIYDTVPPTVVLSGGGSGSTNVATFSVTAQFSETVYRLRRHRRDRHQRHGQQASSRSTLTRTPSTSRPRARDRHGQRAGRQRGRCREQPQHRREHPVLDLRLVAPTVALGRRLGHDQHRDLRRHRPVQRDRVPASPPPT